MHCSHSLVRALVVTADKKTSLQKQKAKKRLQTTLKEN